MMRGDLVAKLPNPHRGDIRFPLLKAILANSGLTMEEWLDGA